MNLIIDAQVVSHDLGGGLRYINGMLQSILKLNNIFNIYIVGHKSVLDFLNIDRNKISLIEPAIDTRHPLKRLIYSYRLNRDLDKRFQHDSIYWLPINYGLPFKMKNIKTILTIHDLNWFQCPEISPFINRQFKKKGVAQAIKNTDVIISISNFTKQQVYLYFKKLILDKPFYVLYEGCTIIDENSFLRHPVLEKRERYILGVKVAGKNKNIEFLLQCFNKFKNEKSYEGKLYLVGWIGKERKEKLLQSIKGTTIENDVEFLGFVKDEELPLFYKNCDLFLFPSYYEGFGLPTIEASNYGAKVCASDATAVEEISKEFAFLASPFDVKSFTMTMKEAFESEDGRRVDKEKYNWDNSAKIFLDICEKTLNGLP